ncbi:MAG: TIGR00282 family metallophosphoesterase [Candidatus Methylomirabilia bacterium]
MKILFIGDIVGKPGRQALALFLRKVQEAHDIDLTIANGENAAGGFGITPDTAEDLLRLGVDVITSGNHVWDKKDVLGFIPKESRLLRPLNYPPGAPGYGSIVVTARGGAKVAVFNVSGRVFMNDFDCPFRTTLAELEALDGEVRVRVVDIHAEATSEKVAFGRFLDGRVSAVVGTHTHIQTADERILPGGTAYITDLGMTGPSESVIGVEAAIVIRKFLTGMPERFETAKHHPQLQGVVIEVDPGSGQASSIERISLRAAPPAP